MLQTSACKTFSRYDEKGEGWCFSSKDFSDLAQSESLGRILRRLERGIIEYPRRSHLFNGFAEPDMDAVVVSLARSHAWTFLPEEYVSLNLLGLFYLQINSLGLPDKRAHQGM